uniref:charged multivesicular body protein 4b-like n=1 Tax=Semicossyphus pulcher TaxID=241346 RepID=UPI0037E908FE
MSLFVKTFSTGKKKKLEKIQEREDLLMKKKEYLKKKIEQELLFVKKNSRKNRKVALLALRRKKCYEKNLNFIDCAIKAMASAHEHTDIVNKVNDLIQDFTEEQDETQDMSDSLIPCLSLGLEFDEDVLLAELERLEKNLDEGLNEKDSTEEGDSCPKELSTASPSHPDTEIPSLSPPRPESDSAYISRPPPTILITAPSREDINASPTTVTIAEAVKERRPLSTPFVVGNKLVTGK